MQLIPNARRAWRLNTVQAATLLVVLSLVQTQFFPLLQLQVPAEVWPWVTAAFGLVIGLLRLRAQPGALVPPEAPMPPLPPLDGPHAGDEVQR